MKIELIDPANLIPYEKNPRNNLSAVEPVKKSIEKFGFKQPIVIDSNKVVVVGHTRLKAALELGLKSVPCIIASDLTKEDIKAYRILDNKLNEFASWNYEDLKCEIEDLQEFNFEDFNCDFDFLNKTYSNKEIDTESTFENSMTLKIKLTEEDYELAISKLRDINEDICSAFIQVINEL